MMNPALKFLQSSARRSFGVCATTALLAASAPAPAASYYVVVPVPNHTAAAQNVAVSLAGTQLPAAIIGQAYAAFDFNRLLSVTGDASYSGYGVRWSVAAGSLPAGLTLGADGRLSGTPNAAGTSSFQVLARYKTKAGEQAYEVVTLNITVSLAGTTLQNGKVGIVYPEYDFKNQLTVHGDPDFDGSKVSFSATNLPAGLSLNNGVLSGTPTAKNSPDGGSFHVAASYRGVTGQQSYTLLVNGQYLDVVAIAPGWTFTCAVTTAGGVKCWGANSFGQLGNGTTQDSLTPVDVVGLTSGVTSLGAGASHACASTATGAAFCWGYNNDGQLGTGTTANSSLPVPVPGVSSAVARVAVGSYHSCVLTTARGAKCWGDNNSGQVGDKSNTPSSPVDVPGVSGIVSLAAGAYHTCAVLSSGGAVCWGTNTHGEIGDGGPISSSNITKSTGPQPVAGLPAALSVVAAGAYETCAITTSGSLLCWGYNAWGQLGNGTTFDSSVPVAVSGLSAGVASVAAGSGFACAKLNSGAVYCWGQNNAGQLGNGTSNRSTPVAVMGLSGTPATLAIGSAALHACVIAQTNAQCWGYNNVGQLGNNATTNSAAPVAVLNP